MNTDPWFHWVGDQLTNPNQLKLWCFRFQVSAIGHLRVSAFICGFALIRLSIGYSRPRRSMIRNHQTIQMASVAIDLFIFESPAVRSMKMMGTSLMRCPMRQAR